MIFDVHGPAAAPVVVLIGSLGATTAVWDRQLPALEPWFRIVRIEHPGHGGAPAPPGPYTVEFLGRRVLEVIDEIGAERPSVAGLSLGGMVAMWLAIHQPHRVDRLALCSAAPWLGPPEMWTQRAAIVRAGGTEPLAEAALYALVSHAPFLAAHPEIAAEYTSILATEIDAEGYAGCCEALSTNDLRPDLARISAPTIVLAGRADPVVSPTVAAATVEAIAGASLTLLGDAAHLANVEQPERFNAALVGHLAGAPHSRGLATRRVVLGDDHVDATVARASDFSRPWQEFLAAWPWGEVWSRPGLDRTTRRLLTIALLAALGHQAEFEVHTRAALRDGVDPAELREVLLHTSVYAGVPAANAAFAAVERILSEPAAQ